jgi:hypothetical protein
MFVHNDVVYTNAGLLPKGGEQGSEQEDGRYRNSHRNGILSPVTIVVTVRRGKALDFSG